MAIRRSASGRSGHAGSRGVRRQCRPESRRLGFTLIEVLVALAIVSIALLAALRAASQGTSNVEELRARLLAGWVAENLLAEQRARGDWPSLGIQRSTQREGGIEFSWREEVVATPNARFRRVDIRVSTVAEPDRQLTQLAGFVVNPPGARR